MKLPFSWLSEYVDLDGLTPPEIANHLTMGAFEVEEIQQFGGSIQGPVVVGEILTIDSLPKTSKVRLTKVKVDAKSEPLEIVCGAQNIAVGQIVPVALPGSTVINRKDGSFLPIKTASIYGTLSNGMLCSPPELGLTDGDSEGILIFNQDSGYKLGEDVSAILSLGQDYILHVSPRSNRGDALSVRGLAREIAALTRRPLKEPTWSLPAIDHQVKQFNTKIEDIEDCELFTIRTISNVQIGEAPPIIKRRLEAVGIRSINNIVDITNYVMHELGQSLHAYDAAKISSQSFSVRRAKGQERIKTIDGKERHLTNEILAIADEKNVVGIAGIMGGLESEVTASTTAIALEAASFTPARVRRGTRLLGLHSEASLRFERGVDVNSVIKASDRASYLIAKYTSGKGPVTIGALSKAGDEVHNLPVVSVRIGQIKRLLDISLSAQEIVTMLKPLGFENKTRAEDASLESLSFAVPSYRRRDVTREIDLIEEICRIYGYERLPQSMPKCTAAPECPDQTPHKVRAALAGQGLSETYISSLVPPECDQSDLKTSPDQFHFGTQDPTTLVRVLNPLSKDHQVLRQSLIPGLIEAAKYNLDHGEKDIWLFEIGRCYFKLSDKSHPTTTKAESDALVDPFVQEPTKVAGLLTGNPNLSKWTSQSIYSEDSQNGDAETTSRLGGQQSGIDFFQTKGIIENLLSLLRIDLESVRYSRHSLAPPMMHPGKSARIDFALKSSEVASGSSDEKALADSNRSVEHLLIGWCGEIHPGLADQLGLSSATYLFELDMQNLSRLSQTPLFKPIMTAPQVSRDLTVDLPKTVDNATIVCCIKTKAGPHCQAIELVSVFPLTNQLKSLSYRLTFQHPELTLRSDEVDSYLNEMRSALTNQLNASFRS